MPYIVLYLFCPKCIEKYSLDVLWFFEEKPQLKTPFFPLSEELSQTTWRTHCCPPSDFKKVVFFRSCDVPAAWSQIVHCIDANLFDQAPKYFELCETLFPNVVFALLSSIFSCHEIIYQALHFYSYMNKKQCNIHNKMCNATPVIFY